MSNVVDINQASRRALLSAHVWQLVEHEPAWVDNDHERLALLTERAGDVAAAFNRGHTDIEAEIHRLVATALAWAERLAMEAAR